MTQKLTLEETHGYHRTRQGLVRSYNGEVELIFRDMRGRTLHQQREHNIIKIPAKEILSHRLPHRKVWDPNASSGVGDWVSSGIDVLEELAAKYIVFGASFDADGLPLDNADDRYYITDTSVSGTVPISLGVGAEYGGGLINAVPIAEPSRPLKRIERVYFEPSYQPAGTPLLQEDVRALNNIVVMETTLRKEEYNGLAPASNFLTVTEVALVAGKELGAIGTCECDPHSLFLEGNGDTAMLANATGTATVTLDLSEAANVDVIKEGDQIKIVAAESTITDSDDTLDQITPYYLVITKAVGGSDITLDRVPTDSDGNPLTGPIGVFKDGFRIFSHRILTTPFKKSADFEVVVRWRIIFA